MKLQYITSRRILIGISFWVMLLIMAAWEVRKASIQDDFSYQIRVKISKIDIAIRY